MTTHPLFRAVLGALLIAFSGIWFALADTTPAAATFYRCVLALPILWVIAQRSERRHGRMTLPQRMPGFLAGAFFTFDLVFAFAAIEHIGVGLAMVVNNTQVVIVALVAWAVLGERPERRVLLAIPAMLLGIVLISGVMGEDSFGSDPLLGGLLALVAAFAYSGFLLLLRRGNPGLQHAAAVLRDATVVAALGGLVVAVVTGRADALAPTWPSIGWLLCLAVGSQVIAWMLISYSLPRVPAAVTSVVLLLQPVGAVLLGMLLLDERPSAVQLAGVVVVIAGVAAATWRRRAGGGFKPRGALPTDSADAELTGRTARSAV